MATRSSENLIVLSYRRHSGRKFQDAMKEMKYQAAVLIMNRRVWNRLKYRHGIKGNHPTDREFEEKLLSLMGEKGKVEVWEYTRIVRRAKFSNHEITREDCEAVWRFYRKFLLI